MAPTVRAQAALVVFLLIPASVPASGGSVTESAAVRLFLEQSPQARKLPWVEMSAGHERRKDALPSNPAIAYQIEDAAGVRDQFLTFQAELPITGRRGLIRDSANSAASAAALAARGDLLVTVSALRSSFYEVLYQENALDRQTRGRKRLEEIVGILRSREQEGEGSGYDLLRAEQELAEIGLAASEAEAALSVARARFGSFFDPGQIMAEARLEGDLYPAGTPPDPGEAIDLALSRRSDLSALRAEARRLDLEGLAARRQRFPEPVLAAGWKRTEALGLEDTGFVAALTLPLPIFDRGQVTAARAGADGKRVALEIEILEREIRADIEAALARERGARRAAELQGGEVERRAGELRRIAELAYNEGEAGILDLLDAHRSSLAMELRALTVRYEARRAQIERDRAIGAEVLP